MKKLLFVTLIAAWGASLPALADNIHTTGKKGTLTLQHGQKTPRQAQTALHNTVNKPVKTPYAKAQDSQYSFKK